MMCATPPPKKKTEPRDCTETFKLQVEINLFCLGTDYLQRFIVGQEAD